MIVRPFQALRPTKELAKDVSSLPYDVMNRKEAKALGKSPNSFLHVIRPEIDLDDSVDCYSQQVYDKAKSNLDDFISKDILVKDKKPLYYIYRQIMNGRVQTGLVACVSIDEYMSGKIKKHEFTRVEKEVDRIKSFDSCSAHTEPVFLTYKYNKQISTIIETIIKFNKPEYDFTSEDGIIHYLWPIYDDANIASLKELFDKIDCLYIADGHHRSASSLKVGLQRREENPNYTGEEEFNFFMAVIFPDEDLFIMDYNRVVKDLNGNDKDQFLDKVALKFDIEEHDDEPFRPTEKHTFGMYFGRVWYKLTAKEGIYDHEDCVHQLDVSILQNNILEPILGIIDPRTDHRIDFIGGIRGLEELERRCHEDMTVAFSMYPTTMDDLTTLADQGEIMPPKSTWFEPKLRSGLFVHIFR